MITIRKTCVQIRLSTRVVLNLVVCFGFSAEKNDLFDKGGASKQLLQKKEGSYRRLVAY